MIIFVSSLPLDLVDVIVPEFYPAFRACSESITS